jgi:hypothetical protein
VRTPSPAEESHWKLLPPKNAWHRARPPSMDSNHVLLLKCARQVDLACAAAGLLDRACNLVCPVSCFLCTPVSAAAPTLMSALHTARAPTMDPHPSSLSLSASRAARPLWSCAGVKMTTCTRQCRWAALLHTRLAQPVNCSCSECIDQIMMFMVESQCEMRV